MIAQKELDQLVHSGKIYDYQSMLAVIEEKYDELKLIPETKIKVPKSFNFWHFSLEHVIGEEIDNGCVRHVNWAELLDENKDGEKWVQDILQIGVDCFGDKTYEVYIGW